MFLLAASAAFVGFFHSLAPGHWLPVVLTAKTRRWKAPKAIAGALVAASGHIILSASLGILSVYAGLHFLADYEEEIERYASLLLVLFGLAYATYAYFRHSGCHDHDHHGPHSEREVKREKAPMLFLFTLGFTPCVAVLPVFIAASAKGIPGVLITMASFTAGVLTALIGSVLTVSRVSHKLHHPIIEHHGDVITGVSVAFLGVVLFLVPL